MTVQDRTVLQQRLLSAGRINDPFLGDAAPKDFSKQSRLWPGDGWADIALFDVTEADGRRFEEYRYHPADQARPVLPVAFMFDDAGDTSRVTVYSDHHLVADRGPILTPVDGIHPARGKDDVLSAYFDALNGNRLDDVLDTFEEDGYFRHSNDETFAGREELRTDFTKMMGDSGIRIRYCRFTDDGRTCAVECYMPNGRPAVATYERGRPGKLKAVRIYL